MRRSLPLLVALVLPGSHLGGLHCGWGEPGEAAPDDPAALHGSHHSSAAAPAEAPAGEASRHGHHAGASDCAQAAACLLSWTGPVRPREITPAPGILFRGIWTRCAEPAACEHSVETPPPRPLV